jgi:hypothetical protein
VGSFVIVRERTTAHVYYEHNEYYASRAHVNEYLRLCFIKLTLHGPDVFYHIYDGKGSVHETSDGQACLARRGCRREFANRNEKPPPPSNPIICPRQPYLFCPLLFAFFAPSPVDRLYATLGRQKSGESQTPFCFEQLPQTSPPWRQPVGDCSVWAVAWQLSVLWSGSSRSITRRLTRVGLNMSHVGGR